MNEAAVIAESAQDLLGLGLFVVAASIIGLCTCVARAMLGR